MKIKEILAESFKCPFFNLLAIANLSLFALLGFSPAFGTPPAVKLMVLLNLPAGLATMALTPAIPRYSLLFPPLVYLQWILIGALAKSIALRIRLKTD